MFSITLIAALIVGAAAVYWLVFRRNNEKYARKPTSARNPTPKSRFGAVEIRVRGGACEAARALRDQRFLAHEAPALPLAGCTASCACSFVKFVDRRTDERRSEHESLVATQFLARNRRSRADRRD